MLPHVKITDLLMEVDRWTALTRHFTHLRTKESLSRGTQIAENGL